MGDYKSFIDFCERIQGEAVNKKCIESLIKAGAFDELGETRKTLMSCYENIIDTISGGSKRNFKGQVSMFEIQTDQSNVEELKYNITKLEEFSNKELLSMEKEMLGLYISGHPLEHLREQIQGKSNINTIEIREIQEETQTLGASKINDDQNVKYIGIINSVKKKYTKNNKLMAFLTVEDLFGSIEVIVFENCYLKCSSAIMQDNIVIIQGRLSIREDEDVKIVAQEIINFSDENKASKIKILNLDITGLSEKQKLRLKGIIKFFTGDKNNIKLQVTDSDDIKPCGSVYIDDEILRQFQELLGGDRVNIIEKVS